MRTHRGTTVVALAGATLALFALTACGGGSASQGDASASDATPVPGASAPPAGSIGGRPDFAAYRDCMAENGVTLPDVTSRPSGGPADGSGPPSGIPGGLPDGVDQEAFDTAQAACADVAPQGGFGGGGAARIDDSAMAAFRSCLADNGVEVTDDQFGMRDLDRQDPDVQAALDTCSPLLPAPPSPPAS